MNTTNNDANRVIEKLVPSLQDSNSESNRLSIKGMPESTQEFIVLRVISQIRINRGTCIIFNDDDRIVGPQERIAQQSEKTLNPSKR